MNKMLAFVFAALAVIALFAFGDAGVAAGLLLAVPAAATLEEIATEFTVTTRAMKSAQDDLKTMYAELHTKTAGNERIGIELKEAIDKAMIQFNGVKDNVLELEQKLAQRVQENAIGEKTWGQQFIEGVEGRGLSSKMRGATIGCEVKAVTSVTAGAGLIRSRREDEIVALGRERMVVGDLMNTIPVQEASVDYPVQTLRTNAAAPVAESAAKPYSDYAWSQNTVAIRVLAHLAKITRQALDDAPRLAGEIDSEMRYGLGYVKERQFLYGTNVGQNLHGIIPQATTFLAAGLGYTPNALATAIDVLRLAALRASLSLFAADGIVMSEQDWALIELTKTTDGAYLMANPQGGIQPRLWGLPVVNTPAMTQGDFVLGPFRQGATIYQRMGVEVLISTENADDFEKNLATMRAEERVALAVKRPGSFYKGTFATILGAGQGMRP